ncbi:MAG: LCP family protein [Saccharofermentanales bacterium]
MHQKTGAVHKSDSAKKSRKSRKVLSMRNMILCFLSLIVVFSISIAAYIFKLLYQNEQTIIPIVDSQTVSEGMLDHLPDPNEDEDASLSTATSGDVAKSQVYWGKGRVKVYVDPNFPIVRVDQKDPNVENFLIFGVDSRSSGELKSRADSMIIVTLDKTYNTIKLTSILRDTQVKIPGRTSPNKINAAYAFGGVGLMVNTINQNFDLDIQKFAMVDMWSAEKIIDAMGGITLNVSSSEVEYVNTGIRETNRMFSRITGKTSYISGSGSQLLTGRQAVAYGRIRKIGSDLGRTARQRKVLSELLKQFKISSLSNKMAVLDETTKSFESNIAKDDMIFLAINAFSSMKNISQYRIPVDGMYTTNTVNWQIIIDYEKQLPALHAYIWGTTDDGLVSLPEESPETDSGISDMSVEESSSDGEFSGFQDISGSSSFSESNSSETYSSESGISLITSTPDITSPASSEPLIPTTTPDPGSGNIDSSQP